MKLIVRIANALAWGWLARNDDATAHDSKCACVACRRYAHGWLDCATEAAGYKTIRSAEADMTLWVALRDGYRGEAS